jgi:nucleoid-associated protein YgaU
MFKKTLIASALALSTLAAFSQAPASPATAAPKTTPAETAKPSADAPVTKHAAKKVKRVRSRVIRANKTVPVPAKP